MKKMLMLVMIAIGSLLLLSCNDQKDTETTVGVSKKTTETKVLKAQASIKVGGSCGMCTSRIEGVVNKFDGVSNVKYDLETQTVKFAFDGSKVKVDDVQQKLADAGHDTADIKAKDETYANLPGCCKYRAK